LQFLALFHKYPVPLWTSGLGSYSSFNYVKNRIE